MKKFLNRRKVQCHKPIRQIEEMIPGLVHRKGQNPSKLLLQNQTILIPKSNKDAINRKNYKSISSMRLGLKILSVNTQYFTPISATHETGDTGHNGMSSSRTHQFRDGSTYSD